MAAAFIPSLFSCWRSEEGEVTKKRGSENIEARQYPVGNVIASDADTLLHEHEPANRQVRLITCDNCPAVDAAKHRTPRDPVHRAESEEGRPERLLGYLTRRAMKSGLKPDGTLRANAILLDRLNHQVIDYNCGNRTPSIHRQFQSSRNCEPTGRRVLNVREPSTKVSTAAEQLGAFKDVHSHLNTFC